MSHPETEAENREVREIWNHNAGFWDGHMGEGNSFVEVLIWPATERLLELRPGERVLDIACGNGLTSRRLAVRGAEVLAFDFAEEMIARARARRPLAGSSGRVEYKVLDATDREALLALGERVFDAALCCMALFDMAHIEPLMSVLPRLLKPGGRFVFSVLHPCFNNPYMAHAAEHADRSGELVTEYWVKVRRYMTAGTARAIAIRGQPRVQLVFHRPLEVLLGAGFRAGMVLDGLEERAFPAGYPEGRTPLSWNGNYSEIPPVLVARMRRPAG